MRFVLLILLTLGLAGCATSDDISAPETVRDVKYFQTKAHDPEPGVEYVRLTARVSGRLNIKMTA